MIRPTRKLLLAAAAATAALLLAACATEPSPYTQEELKKRVTEDRVRMYDGQEPVTGPITVYEAMARALKYNLDYRLKLMEGALAANLRDVQRYEMLPKLVASAGYDARSNDSGGTSIGIVDRIETLRDSTSEERRHALAGLGASWNLLDYGVAYYRTQQRNDQLLMANERRRKVAQNVLQDVYNAYWRALGAQRLLPQVDGLLDRTNKALRAAREAEAKGLLPKAEILGYQRALLDSVYLLTVRRQDLEFARSELAALMSLPPGSKMTLADIGDPPLPTVTGDVDRLEQLALENRPEVMEEWYRMRAEDYDLKIAKAQLWPNVGVNLGLQHDSNKYLYNNDWAYAGITVSMNLFRLLQKPALDIAQDNQAKTAEARRVALSMAVITQVRVGYLRYQLARQEVDFANDSVRVDEKLLEYARSARSAAVGTELETIRAEGRYLLSRYQREAAFASVQAARGRLYNSIGFDAVPDEIENSDVKTIAGKIEQLLREQEQRSVIAAAGEATDAPAK